VAETPAKDKEPAKDAAETKPAPAKEGDKAKAEPAKKDGEAAKKPAAAQPGVHKVKRAPFQVEVALEGVFEAADMTEIVLRPQTWSTFSVLTAVEHGALVKQGDELVTLDMEKIDRAIDDLKREQAASELAVKLAEEQLAALEKTTPLDMAAGERTYKMAHEDYDYYFKVLRAIARKSADFYLKYAQQNLEYQEEELKQLEKMYKADDLTEETEEIVLKRARNAVESARFSLERAELMHKETLEFDEPRLDQSIKDAIQRTDIQWESTKVSLPLALQKQRVDLEKLKLGRARAEEQLQKLTADRAAMVIKAPAAGIVYYGKCTRGKFAGGAADGLRRGSSLTANEVFMTIVRPRPMSVRTTVPEGEIEDVRAGISGTVQPTGFDNLKLVAALDRVAAVPLGAGGFDARVGVVLDQRAERLVPGMTCKVKLITYQNKDAIAVPSQAVATDETDPDRRYVCIAGKGGKSKKRYVTVGKHNEKRTEILAGLSEGERILLECPKKDK
jgi:multidrug resistance efflux pump